MLLGWIKEVLKILLHFDPEILIKIPTIIELINGNFSNEAFDSSNSQEEFLCEVVKSLSDTVIQTDAKHKIKYGDKAFE